MAFIKGLLAGTGLVVGWVLFLIIGNAFWISIALGVLKVADVIVISWFIVFLPWIITAVVIFALGVIFFTLAFMDDSY